MHRTPSSLLHRALTRIGRLAHRRPWTVLSVLVLSLLPAGWFASQLTVRSSFLELLPHDRPAVHQLNDVMSKAQVTSHVVVAISNRDPETARRFAEALSAGLSDDPLVRAVDARQEVEFFRERQLLFLDTAHLRRLIDRVDGAIDGEVMRQSGFDLGLDEEAETVTPEDILAQLEAESPALEPWVVTRDGQWLCLRVVFSGPSGDLDFAKAAHETVANEVAALTARPDFAPLEIRLVGGIAQRLADHQQITGDLAFSGVIGFVAVVLLIVASRRSPRALLLFSVPLFIGLAWTFAAARLTVGHLNIISGFLFSILSGLGIEYAIHLHHRYLELRREGLSIEDATERLMTTTGRALVAIGMTNASVFLVTAFADFSGFNEFGRIAAAGMLLTLISTLLGFPALNVLLERWRPVQCRTETASQRRIDVPWVLRAAILVVVPALAIASVVVTLRGGVRFEGDWRVLQGDSEVARFDEYVRDQLDGTFGNAIIWIRDPNDSQRVVDAVERVHQARRGAAWDVAAVQRVDDVLPPARLQAARLPLIAELHAQLLRIHPEGLETDAQRTLLEDALRWTEVRAFDIDDVPASFVRPFRTVDGQGALIVLRTSGSLRETDAIIEWGAQVSAISRQLEREGIEASILSENWVAAEIFSSIFADGPFLLVGTLLAVFVVLLFDLRSARSALVVLGSVVLGMAALGGGMALTGIDLNFMNAGILPVCIGISLDNAMHIYHRYRVEGREAMPFVLRQTSSANLLSSLTNLLGFGALVVAEHRGLRSVALLAILGVSLTYVSTSIFFPLALQVLGRRHSPVRSPEAPALAAVEPTESAAE